MNLQNELNALRQTVAEKTPPHVVPTIEATTQRLMDSGLVQGALQPGQMIGIPMDRRNLLASQ
jgi:hypothetical protein